MKLITTIIFISLLHFPVNCGDTAAYLIPNRVVTQIGASYVLMLKHETIKPTQCFIENGSKKYSIALFNQGVAPLLVEKYSHSNKTEVSKADDTDVITSLGNGICGFKLDSVSAETATKWNVSFVDQAENTHFKVTTVLIRATFPLHIVQYEKIGTQLHIYCASDAAGDYLKDILNCKLYNPQNELIKLEKKTCIYTIPQSTVSDFGVWKCLQTFDSHMLPTEVTYEFIPKESNIINTWTNETDNHINIGCSVTNATTATHYCVMVRPDSQEIILKPGLATKRYTALDTDFDKSVCVMQIARPLQDSEKGLWRCEHHNSFYEPIGGFVNVSSQSSIYSPEAITPSNISLQINSSLSLACQVPFSSPYCYMRGPDGFHYPLKDKRRASLGYCEFQKKAAQLSDNGTWVCGFAKKTGEPDVVYSFQVLITEKPASIQSKVQEIESRTAGTAHLICSTKGLGDYPLNYCRFLSPAGKMYQVENHQTSDRISYEGRGLQYGDCGIVLNDVSDSDQGTWSCITRLLKINALGYEDPTDELYTNIHLTINDNLSTASTLGIAFGVLAIAILTVGFVLHRYLKRRNSQTQYPELAAEYGDQLTTMSNEEARNYNATDMEVRTFSRPAGGDGDQRSTSSSENHGAGARNYNDTDMEVETLSRSVGGDGELLSTSSSDNHEAGARNFNDNDMEVGTFSRSFGGNDKQFSTMSNENHDAVFCVL